MATIEQLANESTLLKDKLLECYNELKSKFPEGQIQPTDKLKDIVNKLPDNITLN